MTTITQDLTLSGQGLYQSGSKQVAFLKSQPSYLPATDVLLPKYTELAANLTPDATEIVLADGTNVDYPNLDVGLYGSLRVGSEVIIYSQVFNASSTCTVDIIQRNVANTGYQNTQANAGVGTLVSILGTRFIPISKKLKVFNGNLVFTSSNIGLGYYSANVGVSIASPDRADGNLAVASTVYLYANGAVQSIAVTNQGTGYFVDPVVTITGPNSAPFVGLAQLTTL